MSMEVKAEYAQEPEDTPEDEAVDVENTESASPVDTGPSKQGGLGRGVAWWALPHPPHTPPCLGQG